MKRIEIIEVLKDIGLSEKESHIYLTLLELGLSKVQEISKESGLLRTTIYEILDSLIEKGLASYSIRAGVKHYESAEPIKLKNMVEERYRNVMQILPDLKVLNKKVKVKPKVETYEGKEGIKTILSDMLRSNVKELHVFGAEGRFGDMFSYFFIRFHRERVKNGMKLKVIYSEKVRVKKTKEKFKLTEKRFLPGKYGFPSTNFVFGDSVAIVLWSSNEPIAIKIESREIAESYQSYFDLLWNYAKK